jgi:hypothetical protein
MSRYAPVPETFIRLAEMDQAWAERNPGARLDAVRRGARRLHDRIADTGAAIAVRTFPLITFPYPTRFGLAGAALSPAPYVMMRNAMQLVQVEGPGGLVNILVNPSEPDRSMAAPFFARQLERYGEFVSRRVMTKKHGTVAGALAAAGVAPEDIDYVTFDHLHVQDLRGLLGTTEPEPGGAEPTRALLPNARLLAQRDELRTLEHLHPLQNDWYVRDGLRSVAADKLIALDGDYLLGNGFALVRTPGHTEGNHSPTLVTDRGVWTISENGVCVEAYAPECARIPGLRRHARDYGVEVILNANTRERSLDQYTSMVLEKTLADPCPDRPELPQHFPSSEMVKSPLAPGLVPGYSHGEIHHGQVRPRTDRAEATSAA